MKRTGVKQGYTRDKNIDIKHAFMYNNEIVKVSLFYDRLNIQIDDSGIKMSEYYGTEKGAGDRWKQRKNYLLMLV